MVMVAEVEAGGSVTGISAEEENLNLAKTDLKSTHLDMRRFKLFQRTSIYLST